MATVRAVDMVHGYVNQWNRTSLGPHESHDSVRLIHTVTDIIYITLSNIQMFTFQKE